MIRQEIKNIVEKAIKNLQREQVFSDFAIPEIKLEQPEEKTHGHYSSNISFGISKKAGQNPFEIAGIIKDRILKLESDFFEKIEIVKPGFINFFLSSQYLQGQVEEILKKKDKFGQLEVGKNKKVHPVKSAEGGAKQFNRVNVEFISANPTGPLTLGNGRGGFCGDVLANVLNKAGYQAKREYYINDVGEQIRKLGHSVIGDSEAVYNGEYIDNLRKKIKGNNPEEVGEKAAKIILEEMIKPSVKKMGIKFDVWFSEKSLYQKKKVEKVLELLKKENLAYEKKGALWFKSTKFKDDKDRVLIKADGEKTYLAADAAYLKDKFERGFEHLIYIWGADHFGYIERVKAIAEALGSKKEQPDFIIMQMVRLFEKGKEVRMSKRTGSYVTLDELINEVGLDAARFFFLTRSSNTHLNFNLDLAKEQSEKNPVYYAQYAYARICSILRKAGRDFKIENSNLKLLNSPAETKLIKKLIQLPEIIEDTAKDYQVQRLSQYALELATTFHQFYQECQVISQDKELSQSRLSLVLAAKIVLKNTLNLMGISAPEKM